MNPLLSLDRARVLVDGTFGEPRLAHPEGVAIHPDGSLWCGTETGHLLRIDTDSGAFEAMGCTGGFILGIAFDDAGNCFACDLKDRLVYRREAASGRLAPFAASGIVTPNFPVVDHARSALYVSDSHQFGNPGGGIYRYDLATGEGGPWHRAPMNFANGMALAPDGDALFVLESLDAALRRIPIGPGGEAGRPETVTEIPGTVPDGLLILEDATILISCYEPSRIYRWRAGVLELLIEDPQAVLLSHPTNMARDGHRLFTANLGRWHITEIDLSVLA